LAGAVNREGRQWLAWALGALVAGATLFSLALTIADPDLWGYLAFGRLYWQGGRFPYEDVFAYVPTLKPWVYHEWLTGVVFYPLYAATGGAGLQVLKYALGLGTVGLALAVARGRGASLAVAVLVAIVMGVGLRQGYVAVRAQVFTFFFFALTLYLLERVRQSRRWGALLWLPLIMALWGNFHGGFPAGLGLIFLYALAALVSRQPWRPYLAALAAAALATLINPYGWHYWTYLATALTMPRPEISEWTSILGAYRLGVYSGGQLLYILTMMLAGLAVVGFTREATAILVSAVTLALSLMSVRHLPFFLLSLVAFLPPALRRVGESRPAPPRIRAWCSPDREKTISRVVFAMAGVFLIMFFTQKPFSLWIPPEPEGRGESISYPVGAVRFLKERQAAGNLLVHFEWGEYALWHLYPRCRVAIDGRYETVYPPEVCREYFDFLRAGPNWNKFLEHYPPDYILVYPDRKLAGLLKEEPDWRVVYADKGAILFQRGAPVR
jgi:hypothetical protein